MKDERVLVLRLSALGDVIHTIPAVTALKETADVRWVVEAPYRELVEIVAGVEAIPVRMKQWVRSPSLISEAIRAMRNGLAYANVHTASYMSGEIRGQINDDSAER